MQTHSPKSLSLLRLLARCASYPQTLASRG
uniref:Uncharacterized protein n=1 Tax=Salmonella phage PMBT27 TaxID=3137285 RepID=A0AAU8BU86_9VIRU